MGMRKELTIHQASTRWRRHYGCFVQVAHKGTGEKYALKCMEMRRIDVELIDDLRNEIELLKMLDHPNVIKLVSNKSCM